MTRAVQSVLIVGGGIGGMATAMELRRRDIAVDLIDLNRPVARKDRDLSKRGGGGVPDAREHIHDPMPCDRDRMQAAAEAGERGGGKVH